MKETVDFGASPDYGAHIFYVEIPVGPREAVYLYEDFGFEGEQGQREKVECRVSLSRELWTQIRDIARRDFNDRLRAKKLSTGSWKTGKIRLDRFLGRELTVLAWAAEHALPTECLVICQKWGSLRPEERWWFYSKTVAEAGGEKDGQRGWRKALYCALSDGEGIRLAPKTKLNKKKKEELPEGDIFSFMGSGIDLKDREATDDPSISV